MQVCVIPVKEFKDAKERLSGLLSPEERARLAMAMYQDVLSVVMQTTRWAHVLVVSPNPAALAVARDHGALIYAEADQRSQSASVDRAAQLARQMGATALLSLPIDIPLITAEDVEALWVRFQRLRGLHPPGAALALM